MSDSAHNQRPSKPTSHILQVKCPSCGKITNFEYIGEQIWPAQVAEARGKKSVSLWACQECESAIAQSRLNTRLG